MRGNLVVTCLKLLDGVLSTFRLDDWQCGIHGYGEPHHNIATVAFFLDVIEEIFTIKMLLFLSFIYLVRMVEYGRNLGAPMNFKMTTWKMVLYSKT